MRITLIPIIFSKIAIKYLVENFQEIFTHQVDPKTGAIVANVFVKLFKSQRFSSFSVRLHYVTK